MDIAKYLERINYNRPILPDLKTIQGLHFAHMQCVPFENLDIGLKRPIYIDEDALWDKIVVNKRGGFCYELNGLFAWLLKQIGFNVTYLNARVYNPAGELGIDFDHLALLVQIPGESESFLADVGFGDSFTEPLSFGDKGEQIQGLRACKLEQTPDGYIVWQRNYKHSSPVDDGTWERQYFFDLKPHKFPDEYESACLYNQTSPESSFTRGSIISRATSNGRVSLESGRLILTQNGKRIERLVESQEEYQELLQKHFGVVL